MKIELHGRHVELTDRLRDYAERKIGRLDRYLPDFRSARLDLSHGTKRGRGDVFTAQVTAHTGAGVLRAEEVDTDVFAAIDLAAAKLHRQVERYRGKRLDRWHDHSRPSPIEEPDEPMPQERGQVLRRKQFALYEMDEREAIEQLNLVDHDFYVFVNGSNGLVNVLYRRRDGGYGLIEPVLA